MKRKLLSIFLVLVVVGTLFLGVFVKPVEAVGSLTIYSSASDGYTFSSLEAVYNTAWTATTGNVSNGDSYARVGQVLAGGSYQIYRSALYFDTSSIPSGSTILTAVLSVYGSQDVSVVDFDITVTNGQPTYPHDPLVAGDYNKANYSGSGGTFGTAGYSIAGYNDITLNATGRGWVNKGGWTKLTLRSSTDIAGAAPAGGEYVVFYTSDWWDTTQRPKLALTYTVSPSVTCDAASGVGTTTATLNSTITDDGGATAAVEVRWGYGTTSQLAVNFENYTTKTTFSGAYSTGSTPTYAASSLSPGTTYYYRVQAKNSVGTTTSTTERSFTTTVGTPAITCEVASIVGVNSAQLNSTVNDDGGEACDVRFGYGTVSHTAADFALYTTLTAWVNDTYFTDDTPYVSATPLAESTTYYYRVQIRNSAGTVTSTVEQSFTTSASVGNITVFNGYPSTTSINLSWVMGAGDSNAAIYYQTTPYTDPNPNLLTNASFETSAAPPTIDDWVESGMGGFATRSNVQVKTGSYSALITFGGMVDMDISQEVTPAATYQSKVLVFGCWVYTNANNRAKIILRDIDGDPIPNVEEVSSSFHTATAGWEFLTATKTIQNDAVNIYVICQVVAGAALSAYYDGAQCILGNGYPVPTTSTRIYFNNGSNYTHTGLTAGTTYYYVIFGESGDIYSPTQKVLTVTTLGISATSLPTGASLPAPNFPSSMFQTPSGSGLTRFEPFYSLVEGFATSWGMPSGTMWATLVLLIIALISMIVLIESRNVLVSLGVATVLTLGAVILGLLSAWFFVVLLIMSVGCWAGQHNFG